MKVTRAAAISLPRKAAHSLPALARAFEGGDGTPQDCGKRRPLAVKVGDRVPFGRHVGTEVKVDDIEYLVIKESDILAIIDDFHVEEKAA